MFCERHGTAEQYSREKGGGESSECSVKGMGQLSIVCNMAERKEEESLQNVL